MFFCRCLHRHKLRARLKQRARPSGAAFTHLGVPLDHHIVDVGLQRHADVLTLQRSEVGVKHASDSMGNLCVLQHKWEQTLA